MPEFLVEITPRLRLRVTAADAQRALERAEGFLRWPNHKERW